jgi:hypothetical protein
MRQEKADYGAEAGLPVREMHKGEKDLPNNM